MISASGRPDFTAPSKCCLRLSSNYRRLATPVGDFLDQRDQPHAGQDGEDEHVDQEHREARHVYERGIAGFGMQEGRKGALQHQDRLETVQA